MVDSFVEQVLDLAVTLQQIPAPTFSEGRRAEFIKNCFLEEGLVNVELDEMGNVFGRLPGMGMAPPLVVTAHSDTVFPAATDLKVVREPDRICGPGIGDNSLGVAGLFGLLWGLRGRVTGSSSPGLPGDLWLVANVGEEGLGNLRGMHVVVKRFGDQPLAYLVLEGMALGQVYHRGLGVRRYRITARTPGGHSWVDYGRPSAVHEIASLITRLVELPLPSYPRTTLNVGVISGGVSVNTIAPEAYLELDIRSESSTTLLSVARQVESMLRDFNRDEVQFTSRVVGNRPLGKIPSQHPLVRLALQSLAAAGLQGTLNVGSTDANVPLSLGLPAICLGLTTGSGAHTMEEYIDTRPLSQGLAQLLSVVEGVYQQLEGVGA